MANARICSKTKPRLRRTERIGPGRKSIAMKPTKPYLAGAVLFAALALSAIAASGASALESVWLVEGVAPTAALETVTTGAFLIDLLNEAKELVVLLHCEALFIGTIATGGNAKLDEVTKVLTLAGVEVGELGSGAGIDCTVVETLAFSCDNSSKLAEFWPDNLPWPSAIVLQGGGFDDDDNGAAKNPGFDLLCLDSLGLTHENLCEGPIFALLENTVENDVLAKFPTQELKPACTLGKETGFVEGSWLMTVPGKTLSVGEA